MHRCEPVTGSIHNITNDNIDQVLVS